MYFKKLYPRQLAKVLVNNDILVLSTVFHFLYLAPPDTVHNF